MVQFNGIASQDTQLSSQLDLSQNPVYTPQNLLWQYHNNGSMYGIPVREQDKDLTIESQDQLLSAITPVASTVQTWAGLLGPEHKQDLQKYAQIQKDNIDGKLSIISQDKQFSTQSNAFIVVITYAVMQCRLNPQYEFFRQDKNNGE